MSYVFTSGSLSRLTSRPSDFSRRFSLQEGERRLERGGGEGERGERGVEKEEG